MLNLIQLVDGDFESVQIDTVHFIEINLTFKRMRFVSLRGTDFHLIFV